MLRTEDWASDGREVNQPGWLLMIERRPGTGLLRIAARVDWGTPV